MGKLYNLKSGVAEIAQFLGAGVFPGLTIGKAWFVDPVNGNNANSGDSPDNAYASVQTAYNSATGDQHDTIFYIGGDTAFNPTANITWAKDHTHLIGLSSELPGMGQRCRIVNTTANDLTALFTLSAHGCIIKNIQFFDGKDANVDGVCVLVSGDRNYFENVFVAGMGHATPAARAGSYSLKVSGSENTFRDCTIGLDTIVRAAANSELIVSGARNRFVHCDIRSYSETAGKFLVKIDNAGGDLRDTIFDECIFFNYTVNWATGITDAFDMPASGSTHYVLLHNCSLFGVGTGWADTVTHIYGAGPAPNAGFGVAVNPTT